MTEIAKEITSGLMFKDIWGTASNEFDVRLREEAIKETIQEAVEAEREACAALCEEKALSTPDDSEMGMAGYLADLIRARSLPKSESTTA